MESEIYEEFDAIEISRENGLYKLNNLSKKVISEISLKIIVNGMELVSLLCLNQHQSELALGFLYSEGVINSYEDVEDIYYNEKLMAVIVRLKEGILVDRQESLRSITSGCGKCYTYINPLKQSQYRHLDDKIPFSLDGIMEAMKAFIRQSEVFRLVGGVHSILFHTPEYSVLNEDIGRHNCFDKITGILLKEGKLNLTQRGVVFISGRISSEIMTKVIRLGTPVLVSRSTPTTAAVRLAEQYHVTLLGYVREDRGYIYTGAERIKE